MILWIQWVSAGACFQIILKFEDVSFDAAIDAGEETILKTRQYSEVLPCEEFIAHINSSLFDISQRQNRYKWKFVLFDLDYLQTQRLG